ncbi:putative toxin-antitoxin system toxin component, PIN family [candidate division WOR-1 bacterium RIFOXYA12_FULL_43_27]|uniref:Putative toxin-antitoxin system toxin component, PIN family n=1 Tax=candidate division WOR-1 bacterium RIFOXYC2_FULL_46_14 TaxID=1802587 RepID=A0A1F4U6H5_UNCSA|nr:MAG: putative toxin-antitoxin system toxin component, PIN family [candidate division WOR-1 bacterium RIFOXYA12_FULL_43_27]OGC20638.1 MAG: putative toxin-antitoxin system toxin component, PIN family [candidate division WOR-1 bacterium RIFOXYB2_FULL_46_45]OGC31625.1 MAG: putative toxin-antitoxin system toxin component, PIN family [candidate division WOR-1 bacterium RIFOXYA2_FULL_46_56]OGC40479.1 MAG: putative toxin-antitoxin system toxin component, PIN family [candidate division WOR-1 bacterium
MFKAVLDTNIFVSGITWQGLPGEILDLWIKGKIQLIISKEIMEEIKRVLNRMQVPEEEIANLRSQIIEKAIIVDPQIKISLIKKDPSDNKFLECAIEGQADFIVSGDKHLLEFEAINDIKIITARKMLEALK